MGALYNRTRQQGRGMRDMQAGEEEEEEEEERVGEVARWSGK